MRVPGFTFLVLLTLALGLSSTPASAQIPDEFTNLEVLSKEIAKPELIGIMRGFAIGLGVRCNHCHVGESPTNFEGYDFASDEKRTKRTARKMLEMVQAINREHLPEAELAEAATVECATCHRGISRPARLAKLMLDKVKEEGTEAASNLYRELRAEHFGSAAYDFSPATLTEVSETLAQENLDQALTMIRLSLEFDPDVAYSRLVEGQILLFQGKTEAGFEAVQKAIDLEPENPLYKQQMERAKARFGGKG